jgi:hypothetical protein
MKNTEETKHVPGVDEVVMEELRKRNIDVSTFEGNLKDLTIIRDIDKLFFVSCSKVKL